MSLVLFIPLCTLSSTLPSRLLSQKRTSNITPLPPKAQGSLPKRRWKDCRRQRQWMRQGNSILHTVGQLHTWTHSECDTLPLVFSRVWRQGAVSQAQPRHCQLFFINCAGCSGTCLSSQPWRQIWGQSELHDEVPVQLQTYWETLSQKEKSGRGGGIPY